MHSVNSLEKTLMVGKTEGKRSNKSNEKQRLKSKKQLHHGVRVGSYLQHKEEFQGQGITDQGPGPSAPLESWVASTNPWWQSTLWLLNSSMKTEVWLCLPGDDLSFGSSSRKIIRICWGPCVRSWLWLWDRKGRLPGSSALWLCGSSVVLHYLLEFAQIHFRGIGDAFQPSHPLLLPSSLAFNLSQHQGLFQWVSSFHQVTKVLELQCQSFQWIFRVDFL